MSLISLEKLIRTSKKTFNILVVLGILMLIVKLAGVITDKYYANSTARQNAICPSLLSISRSARDTLIVMKAENLCNSYVLDNLK